MPFGDSGDTDGEKRHEITAAELGALLSGIDLSHSKAQKTISPSGLRSRVNIGYGFLHSDT